MTHPPGPAMSPREIGQRARELLDQLAAIWAGLEETAEDLHIAGREQTALDIANSAKAVRQVHSKLAALRSTGGDPRVAAVRQVIESGGYRIVGGAPVDRLPLRDECDHGQLGCQDCISCYDEALLNALSDTGETG